MSMYVHTLAHIHTPISGQLHNTVFGSSNITLSLVTNLKVDEINY